MTLGVGRADAGAGAAADAVAVVLHDHHLALDLVVVFQIDELAVFIDAARVITPRAQTLKQRPQPIQTFGSIDEGIAAPRRGRRELIGSL